MYKLMIIEDEPWIAKGLEVALPWEEYGIELTGSAANGEEALRIIEKSDSDIILTDIMMPIMNGLDMLENLSKRTETLPKVIIITGYNDFSYAQQAIRYGVEDYLLKPIDQHELEKTILSIVQKLNKQKQDEQAFLAISVENLIYESLSLEQNRKPEIQFPYPVFRVLFSTEPLPVETFAPATSVAEYFYLYFQDSHLYVLGFETDELADSFAQTECSGFQGRFSVGISSKYEADTFCFFDAYKEAEQDFHKRPMNTGKHTPPVLLATGQEKQWVQLLQKGKKDEVYAMMEKLLLCHFSFNERWGLMLQFYLFLSKHCHPPLLTSPGGLIQLKKARNDKDLKTVLETVIGPLLGSLSSQWQYTISDIARKAVRYIEQQYSNPYLSLQQVADGVGVSAAYLSVIFKNEIGMNYIHFLTITRIEKAKKELADTKKTCRQISICCGFNDVKYFTRVFKKTTGFTPNKFREIHG
ncbi:response regulator [Bacillus sp. T33-2]|uniref:response regulator n=1 Tax=Bacillus sp. T33-2 TaxID=2054168 RepID=UPI000C78AA80|nr:response regulator [Bacillus sp. T33-2]PLR94880.1 hypothetical protein CVD19_16575 [Bacillus sp. T33-2]